MHEPEDETITNPENDVRFGSSQVADPIPTYAGSGRTLEYALAKAVDDALALPNGRKPDDNRPVRRSGERLVVARWEVVLGNGHVPDHIIWLR